MEENNFKTYIGSATTLNKNKFDEGWVDSGKTITLLQAINLLK